MGPATRRPIDFVICASHHSYGVGSILLKPLNIPLQVAGCLALFVRSLPIKIPTSPSFLKLQGETWPQFVPQMQILCCATLVLSVQVN